MKRSISATEAARKIATELGQNPDSKGTARLAEDLGKKITYTVIHNGRKFMTLPDDYSFRDVRATYKGWWPVERGTPEHCAAYMEKAEAIAKATKG